MVSAWIPLEDCTLDMGPISFIDGSHLWPASFDCDTESLESLGPNARAVPLAFKRGQVSFHHCLTIHGSASNRTRQDRLALCIHYQDGDNAYAGPGGAEADRALHLHPFLRRKDGGDAPDYADPVLCPTLFKASPPLP
jgi:ectoine hydroxylase-related dioxygenase (phytanoyl-CoA dioxygenase family)